ncbi:MAG: ATP-binding protein [Pseudomonadota bacterium]
MLCLSGTGHAQSGRSVLELRKLTDAQLIERYAPRNEDVQGQTLAQLVLADRSFNRSSADVRRYLEAAESGLEPGTYAADWALAIRCQLEHREGSPDALNTCAPLLSEFRSDNRFVQGYVHATLSYVFYREGDHARSLEEAYRTLTIAENLEDPGLLAWAHNVVGLHFNTKLLPRRSVHHLEMAWDQAGRLPNPEFKGVVQLNLASNYTYLGRAGEALEMLREVKATPLVDLYPTRRLAVQSMIAQAHAELGQVVGVEEALQAVLKEVEDSVLPDAVTFANMGLGIVQLAKGQPEQALLSFEAIFETIGQDPAVDLEHPRIQLVVVPYARALREAGRLDQAQTQLELVIASIPEDQPDQLLLDAYREMDRARSEAGDLAGAQAASETAARLETALWDDTFAYKMARLSASLEMDQRKVELAQAAERELILRENAQREKTLRRQSWLIGIMLVGILLALQSLRMQRKIAAAEHEANERLEELVQTRTQELETEIVERMRGEEERRQLMEKLSEGEKMRALGQLTAGIAHDFNNLMSVITLTADHLKIAGQAANADSAVSMLDDIVAAADTGAKITGRLLAYVRKQPLRPVVVPLEAFLRDNLPLFRNTLGERLTLTAYLEPCEVLVDKAQLTTSLINLLLNSREAMEESGKITLTLNRADGHARIVVEDQGAGMDEATLRKACDPFFTTKEVGEGTGLGLSMVFGFARQSGGDLKIESEAGRGTRVILQLPLAQETAAHDCEDDPREDVAAQLTNVLVVEDRDLLLQMLQRTLAQMGMQVTAAQNADEALTLVEEIGLPDLLISDVVMPGQLDGADLAARLRERDPTLPVVLISGYSEAVGDEYGFLRKPFSVSELKKAVADAVREMGRRRDVSPVT